MKKISFIRTMFFTAVLAFSFACFSSPGILYAQDAETSVPDLTQEESQPLRELYGLPSEGAEVQPDSNFLSAPILAGEEPSPAMYYLSAIFGEYWWIIVALYFIVLLFIVFILYASVFKQYKRFSREQAVAFGWNTAKKHIWFFVLVSLIQIIIYLALFFVFALLVEPTSFGIPQVKDSIPYAWWYVGALIVATVFFFVLFTLGTTRISLTFIDGARARIADLFGAIVYMPKFILAALLYYLIIFGPYILLEVVVYFLKNFFNPFQLVIGYLTLGILFAIPVSYWIMKFYIFYIIVVDKKVWPIKALKLASRYSKGARTDLALFVALLTALNIIGFNVPLWLGLFMSMPLTSLAFAHAYRQLEKSSQ